MLYTTGGQEGSRGSKTDQPEKALLVVFFSPSTSISAPFCICAWLFFLSLQIGFFHLFLASGAMWRSTPLPSPAARPRPYPTETDLHSFSAPSVMGLVSLPDPVPYDGEKGAGLTVQLQLQRSNRVDERQVWEDRDQMSRTDTWKMTTAESVMCSLRSGHQLSLIWWLECFSE